MLKNYQSNVVHVRELNKNQVIQGYFMKINYYYNKKAVKLRQFKKHRVYL